MDIQKYRDLINQDITDKPLVNRDIVEYMRNENVELAKKNKPIKNIIPQKGFQEIVCLGGNKPMESASIMIIGGKRGGGKTFGMLLTPMYNIDNPLFVSNGFRREEKDILRGFWSSSKSMYMKMAEPTESSYTWGFPSGAKIRFEHLQDQQKIDQRFRGTEMPMILLDELPQINEKTFFTLLASNRNTIGVDNRFIASCNPVGSKHWVYKLIEWYINQDTHEIIPERSGKIRYFYRHGDNISDIFWGNTKEEVYELAKTHIDFICSEGEDPLSLITSLCFIDGDFADNEIFKAKDPSYKGRLAAQGGQQSIKDIKGLWVDANEESSALLSSSDFENMFNNQPQTSGKRYCIADVALSRDFFVLYAFDGRHVFDIEYFNGTISSTAVDICRKFLEKNSIREENFLYDGNGIGLYLEGFFKKAKKFNNKAAASDPKLWNNLKSECAEKFVNNVKEYKYSISESVLNRIIGQNGQTIEDRLQKERQALRRKENDNGRFEIIGKPEMKSHVGHSPDFIESLFMREYFSDKEKKSIRNLGMLNFR